MNGWIIFCWTKVSNELYLKIRTFAFEIISRRRYGIKIRKGSLSYLQVAVLIVKRRRREGSLQPSIPVENERDCRQKHHDHSG